MDDAQVIPRYGSASLADVLPAVLAAINGSDGTAGSAQSTMDLGGLSSAAVLLVDGLGWELLTEHAAHAPALAGLLAGGSPLTAGFPATTATSLSALGTGTPPGMHGIVGYSFAAGHGGLLNPLSWRSHPDHADLRGVVRPEALQPDPTVFQRAADGGVAVSVVVPAPHVGSGLSAAALRGGRFVGTRALGDLVDAVSSALSVPRSLCYAYHGDLDLLGHVHGPGSGPWLAQLRVVDRMVEALLESVPPDAALLVLADHGMVAVTGTDHIEVADEPGLLDGVRLFGGEVRARQLYTEPGARDDVLAAWRSVLGDRAWVSSRDEAIDAGWFGPVVHDRVRERIGDVVAAMRGSAGVVREEAEPMETSLLGHHGSLTAAEQLVPLLVHRG